MVGDYLSDKSIEFSAESGIMEQREIKRCIQQKSVLGSLLWNIGYNYVVGSHSSQERETVLLRR